MLRDGAGGAGSAGQRGTSEGRGPEEKKHWWETRRGSSYIPWLRWRRARADIAAEPVRTGAGAAAPVEDRRRQTSRSPQAES